VLYQEAVTFVQEFVSEYKPLPSAQANGLLGVAEAYLYGDLLTFVRHQRDRNWPRSRREIKEFYTRLEKKLIDMQNRRLKNEFQLVTEGLNSRQSQDEKNELMAQLSHEFIQHVVAENMLLGENRGR
jgi:hypothetical protein